MKDACFVALWAIFIYDETDAVVFRWLVAGLEIWIIKNMLADFCGCICICFLYAGIETFVRFGFEIFSGYSLL